MNTTTYSPACPDCGKTLQKVTRSADSMLNAEQFDAVRCGDWFCDVNSDGMPTTSYTYFWDRDLSTLSTAAEQAAKIADLKRTIEWLQGRIGILMGAAALAEIAGAPDVAQLVPNEVQTDDQMEAAWEARKLELAAQYPGIAGNYKVFEVLINTETGCQIDEGEYSIALSRIINGVLDEDDWNHIRGSVMHDIGEIALPEEGQTAIIIYESGEREDVFWNKFYRLATTPAEQPNQDESK